MSNLEAINETSYLSVPNAPVYRKIMRCFYREYEKMNFKMYKEDIFRLLKQDDMFQDYTLEQLVMDLDALVKWKNLTPIQDPGRVYTIAEYKNKQYQYTMSEYAVEIERMTVRLENLFVESGNLSTNFFVRIERSLDEAEDMQNASLKDINEWWNLLQEDFKRLNQNYQDYLRDFYSGKSEQLMKSVEFIVHKDKFIKYLTEFIQEMQRHSRKIQRILEKNTALMEDILLEKVVQSELEIPHATLDMRGDAEPSIRENVAGKWNSLKNWFVDSDQRECECKKVLRITNDVIRSIIQNAALIKTLESREEDSINNSVYEETPSEFLLKPHTRNYREKKDKRGFKDKSFQKMIQREAYLRQARQQKEIVMHYIKDNKITFSEIEETVTEDTRTVFLQWITQANMNSQKTGRTEYGQEYRLIRKPEKCVLKCEDGKLVMPSYILEFK